MKIKPFTFVLALSFTIIAHAQTDTLFVYGPGGPQAAMEECAKAFSKKMSVPVRVVDIR